MSRKSEWERDSDFIIGLSLVTRSIYGQVEEKFQRWRELPTLHSPVQEEEEEEELKNLSRFIPKTGKIDTAKMESWEKEKKDMGRIRPRHSHVIQLLM